jgi:hypothetical protein
VRGSEREQPRADAAQIDRVLAVEQDVSLTHRCILQQLGDPWREAREPLGEIRTELIEILLLLT